MQLRIVALARGIVPVLLDAGRAHSAKELQDVLLEMDGCDAEMREVIKTDHLGVVAAMIEMAERQRT